MRTPCMNMWVKCLLVATVLKVNETGEATLPEQQKLHFICITLLWKMKHLINSQAVIEALELPWGASRN